MNLKKLIRRKLKVGDAAPDFVLPRPDGSQVKLSDYLGKKVVVLYFYPKDDTYGCIAESSDFRDQYAKFQKAGAEVIGVSSDTPASHEAFARKYQLPFVLLSDEKHKAREDFRVPSTLGMIPGRVTFVIDKKGVIRHIFNSQFHPHSHVAEAIQAIQRLTDA